MSDKTLKIQKANIFNLNYEENFVTTTKWHPEIDEAFKKIKDYTSISLGELRIRAYERFIEDFEKTNKIELIVKR